MRTLILVVAVGFSLTAVLAATPSQTPSAPKLHQQTLQDLDKAMHGEAFAFAKYTAYAQHARKSGHEDIAKLFEDAARTEHTEHFAEEAELAGLARSDADNLRDAIKGESYEVDSMYPDFARKATAVGDKAAAERFDEIRKDELKHRDGFKAALNALENPGVGGH